MKTTIITACLVSLFFAAAADAHPGARIVRRHVIKKKIAKHVSEEVKQAAAAVKADLEAIRAGGFVSKEDLKPLFEAAKAAASDRELTDAEKAALREQAQAIAAKVPQELRDQLKADVATLRELIGEHRG